MKRREFLEMGAVAGAALLAGGEISAQTNGKNALTAAASAKSFELEEMTVSDLQKAMTSGKMSAREIVGKYLDRIAALDPQINSVIEINPDAFALADAADRERRAGKTRSALMHGIPVLLKDNIDTADKMKTTAGSLALADAPTPKADAFIVQKLRAAGAIVLGKTNLSEWANFRSSSASSGWSGRGGQTRNPYILSRSPCGSSSGSGAAVAANLAAVAIGTETDGSIVCPASVCGLVGLKPTLGLVSRSGIIPIAHSQDTAGPMTRSVADAAALLNALIGADSQDAITMTAKAEKDYTKFLSKDGLKNARIGVARDYFGKNALVDALMNEALDALKKAGAQLFDVTFPTLRQFGAAEFEVLLYEFKNDLNQYLAARGGKHRTLADLIKFNEENRTREMPFFGQELFLQAEAKGTLDDRSYRLALLQSKVLTQERGIDAALKKDNLDAIAAPSNSPTWMIDLINGDCGDNYVSSSSLAAVAGYPNITVPAGFLRELPIGISFFGGAFTEPKLLRIAYAFEQITKTRRPPKLIG